MAETIIELISGPRVRNTGSGRSAEVEFRARGFLIGAGGSTNSAMLQQYVEEEVKAEAETIFGSGGFRSWPLSEINTESDGLDWKVSLVYSVTSGGALDDGSESSFDTGSDSQHIIYSRSTRSRYPVSPPPPDFKKLVGVSGDNVDGADLLMPNPRFSETRLKPAGEITNAYKRLLYQLTGTVNGSVFMGNEIGEVLFLGARGQRCKNGLYEINYEFAWSPNKYVGGTGVHSPISFEFPVGGAVDIEKAGWDYLWVYYSVVNAGSPSYQTRVPVSAYVERVYEAADFGLIGL